MAAVTHSEVFDCSPEKFYSVITDYVKYPEFLQEVKKIEILKSEENKKLLEYTVSVLKTFKYQLWMYETPNKQVRWELAGGDLFKASTGSWVLEPTEEGKTKATYSVDVTFNIMVPGPVAKALVSSNLPNMMKSYHKRLKGV